MKRFFCTKCNRVKRVRNFPTLIETPASESVFERKGECDRHSLPRLPRVLAMPQTWTEANLIQAEGRFNRKPKQGRKH